MRVFIFTPTCRFGGLDVTYSSIMRQDADVEKVWLLADELHALRHEYYDNLEGLKTYSIDSSKWREGHPDRYRTLALSYNWALDVARVAEADLFISLQDYIWAPPDGISRFLQMAEDLPNSILTGITSISNDPTPEEIVNPEGLWTIFGTTYSDQPKTLWWRDERFVERSAYALCDPMWFETNWAALPKQVLMDKRLDFDVSYDEGVAYENQDFALKASEMGYATYLDTKNEAISLPHKQYWPEEEQADMQHLNARMHHKKWIIPLPPDLDAQLP